MKDDQEAVRLLPEVRHRLEEDVLTDYDHAQRAGFIGAAHGGVRDPGTSPKYFDRFGGSSAENC